MVPNMQRKNAILNASIFDSTNVEMANRLDEWMKDCGYNISKLIASTDIPYFYRPGVEALRTMVGDYLRYPDPENYHRMYGYFDQVFEPSLCTELLLNDADHAIVKARMREFAVRFNQKEIHILRSLGDNFESARSAQLAPGSTFEYAWLFMGLVPQRTLLEMKDLFLSFGLDAFSCQVRGKTFIYTTPYFEDDRSGPVPWEFDDLRGELVKRGWVSGVDRPTNNNFETLWYGELTVIKPH